MVHTHEFNILKQLKDGRVEKVVAAFVPIERVDHRLKEVSLDNVAVVELVLHGDDFPHEPKTTCEITKNGKTPY